MKLVCLIAAGALVFGTSQLVAQEEEEFHSEITVSGIGAFTSGVTGQGIHQTASSAGGILATYRYMFNKYNGIETDYSHAQFTQQYSFPALIKDGIHSDLDEFTASYVFRYPYKRVSPYATAGTGGVLFNPSHFVASSGTPATRTVDAAFAYGAGIDVRISKKIAFRAGYRGLVYSAPDFGITGFNTKKVTNLAEPTAGFSIRL